MKIWYQTYSPSPKIDPKWRDYSEACERYVPTLARPGTEVHFADTDTRAPKMILSGYIQYLHVAQVIENAIRAEREGFDAFVIGGMRDLGYRELREAVDIPVVFIGEASYHAACLLAQKFAIIHSDRHPLLVQTAIVKRYGLEARMVTGGHLGYSQTDLIAAFRKDPKRMVSEIRAAAKPSIEEGAGILVPGFAAISSFLAEQGVRDIDGVPLLDCQAVAIKTAEMQVDLRRAGMPKPGEGGEYRVVKKDIETARSVYGIA
jgi:Asp/Glu/hydantoin racemase